MEPITPQDQCTYYTMGDDLQVHVTHVPSPTIEREVPLKRSRSFPIKMKEDLTLHAESCCRETSSGPLERVGCNDADAEVTDPVTSESCLQGSQSPVLMNFDAFIYGVQQLDQMQDAKKNMVQPEVCFKSSNTDLQTILDHDRSVKETPDQSDSVANGASKRKTVGLLSIKSAAVAKAAKQLGHVKEKTQQVVQTRKQVMSVFQQKGGLVGWLHGEGQTYSDCDDGLTTPVGSPSKEIHDDNSPLEENKSESPSTKTPPQSPSRVVLAPSQFKLDSPRKPGIPSVPRSPVTQATELISQRQRSASLFGSIYEKMVKSLPDTTDESLTERRIALQPSPRKEVTRNETNSFDFDDFVNSDGITAKSKFFRDSNRARTVSAAIPSKASSPLCKSRSASLSAIESASVPPGALTGLLSLEECLADPKLAAEFVNTVIPDDSSLLMLLYSIEEFETLVTADPIPTLQVQITYAMALIDKFLTPVKMSPLIRSKLSETTAVGLKQTLEQYHRACAPSLPKTLFRSVYTELYAALRVIYDAFKQTREYTLIVDKQESDRPAMVMDAVLANEWFSTVLWAYLYRTSHHHRLSFLMEKTATLDRLYRAFLDAKDGGDENIESDSSMAVSQNALTPDQRFDMILILLQSMTRKFFQKSSPMAIQSGSSQISRLKDEICVEITHLDSALDKTAQNAALDRIILKIDELAVDVQAEFKRVSFERYSSFTASTLYRDFIDLLQTSNSTGDDLIRLLRTSRISFHQTPNDAPVVPTLSSLVGFSSSIKGCPEVVFADAITQVFAFTKRNVVNAHARVQPFEYTNLFNADQSVADSEEAVTVFQTVEHFLTPEASPRTFQLTDHEARQHLCFNFVAGSGENCLYGAVWRMPLMDADGEVTTQGVCVLSKYPLMESLREYLRFFASHWKIVASETDATTTMRLDACDHTKALDAAQIGLRQYLLDRHVRSAISTQTQIDFDLRDLFDCLSITHILRLFSLLLLEKKVVLVASRYSVLVAVGEALKTLLKPLLWSHIYVPVLPLALKGYLHCPTPFIFGVHASYVKNCELPRASEDLAIVNLDRDSVTGGGDVVLSPARMTALRDKLWKLCKPRLQTRDSIYSSATVTSTADIRDEVERNAAGICELFNDEVRDILMGLEACATRFECGSRCISVVESTFGTSGSAGSSSTNITKCRNGLSLGCSGTGRSPWPSDAARFNLNSSSEDEEQQPQATTAGLCEQMLPSADELFATDASSTTAYTAAPYPSIIASSVTPMAMPSHSSSSKRKNEAPMADINKRAKPDPAAAKPKAKSLLLAPPQLKRPNVSTEDRDAWNTRKTMELQRKQALKDG